MGFIKKHPFFFLFFLGLLIRLSLVFLDYSWDVNNHMVWAKDFLTRGPRGFYQTQSSNVFAYLFPNYPPFSVFLFALVYPLQSIIHGIYWWINLNIPFAPSNLIFFLEKPLFLASLFKLPGIVADLGIAYIIYLLAKKKLFAPALILFNPAFIFNSALWGQIDSLPIFFVLISVYWLIYMKNYLLTSIWFLIALLIKPTVLVFLPFFIVFFGKKYGIKNSLITLFVCNLIFWFSFLPFFKNGNLALFPYITYLKGILSAQSLPFVTNGAFNFWVLVTGFEGIQDTATFALGISYRFWSYLIVGLLNLLVIYYVLRTKNKIYGMFMGLFLAAFSAFLFLTKMHERYTLLILPFLLLVTIVDKKSVKWFLALSLMSFLNHYHSWPVPKVEAVFAALTNSYIYTLISLSNILIFFYLLYRLHKERMGA